MKGVNKAIVIGTLGQDPDVKATANGGTICNVSVATNESWKDKNTGEKKEATEWHRIVMFGKLAEIAAQYLKKGSQAYFEGRIQTRKWQDGQGNDRYSTEINASQMQMLGSKGEAQQPRDHVSDYGAVEPEKKTGGGDFDDIPFAPVDWRAS